MTARSDLSGLRILVDTYNLRLLKGTGIKAYGLTLIEALRGLQAELSLLTDVRKPKTKYAELNEALVFDVRRTQRRRWWRTAAAALSGLNSAFVRRRAEQVRLERVIPDDRFGDRLDVPTLFNTPQCFKLADAVYKAARRLTRIALPSRVDIFHATCPLPIRVRGAKLVTTIHDLIPLKLPYTTLDNKRVFFDLVRNALRDSDLILAVSECTKRDILTFFDVPEKKIAVTYQSVPETTPKIGAAMVASVLRKYGLASGRYILFVGNIEPKKNVRVLLRAMAALDLDLPLVAVGRKAWLWREQVQDASLLFGSKKLYAERVRWLEYVSASDLSALYSNAACFVFPSLYEGFGLPPLEAMRYGCPVITSNVASLPEVCADAALYVDPRDPDDVAQKIALLLDKDALRRQLIEAGRDRVSFFGMDRYRERLFEAYTKVMQ